MEAYSYADHRVQIRQAAIMLLLAAVFIAMKLPLSMLVVGLMLGLVTAAVTGGRARIPAEPPRPCGRVCAEAFLAWLATQSRSIRIAKLQWDQALTSGERVCRGLAASGFTSPTWIIGRHQLVLAVSGVADCHVLQRALVTATAGTLQCVRFLPNPLDGTEISRGFWFDSAFAEGRSIEMPDRESQNPPSSALEPVVATFRREFPEGICLRVTQGELRQLGDGAGLETRQLLRQFGHLEPQRRNRASGIETAVYRPLGDVTAVFVVPRASTRLRQFVIWRKQLSAASIQDTLHLIVLGASGPVLRQTASLPLQTSSLNP
jgi:hypothetical protein